MPPHHPLPILLLLLFISAPSPAAALNTVADCGPSLLPLSPCAPFVQGSTPAPVRKCCDSVEKLYKHNVTCLCVLLDNSGPELPLPINTTLALQLPLLCKLNISPTTCPGVLLPSPSPHTNASVAANPNSRAKASPMGTGSPRPRFVSFAYHNNAEVRIEAETRVLMLIMAAIFFLQ
ncbi:non-specific lipid transfer protein GPI-anchored 10-like isoform X2 [Salvia splendens]|uniref:non-specific lipid transfer protein GPI-anchored 10-like isoform X2 n=1 Tax=Salvia splendens TaxID=180675 RepID=UPI001C279F7E|nr:non-specific lipid transfer protein GPI-anchored 10-like isoform X2 [Salvia splendens]